MLHTMGDDPYSLHVVVGASAAGSLATGLRDTGRDDQIACFPDDLSFGPIDPPDPAARMEWIAGRFNIEWENVAAEANFWDRVLSWPGQRIVWLSRRSPR